jgi:NAD(P)-dependent dehydrogenase (short-subunit alcohol dehydrogenase family)
MKDLFRLDGKVAIVLGGGGGIGKELAKGLAFQGAKVGIASRDLAKLEKVVTEMKSDKSIKAEIAPFACDVADEKSIEKLAAEVVAKWGTVDILVNSQGQNFKRPALEYPMNDWDFMFNVNVRGLFTACKVFGKIMVAKKSGKIVNLSSVVGLRAARAVGNVGYGATKGAVDQITRGLGFEWATSNVQVNAIGPGVIITEMMTREVAPEILKGAALAVPMQRLGTAEELMGVCIYLSSAASDFMTGQTVYVDGGRSCVA